MIKNSKFEYFLNFLPTFGWFFFSLFPFFLLEINSNIENTQQSIGIFAILFFIFVADLIVSRKKFELSGKKSIEILKSTHIIAFISLIICLLFPLLQVITSGKIPILTAINDKGFSKQWAMERQSFNHVLDHYFPLNYLGNWIIVFFAPIVFSYLISINKKLLAFVFVSYSFVFTILSGEKSHFLILITIYGLILSLKHSRVKFFILVFLSLTSVLMMLGSISSFHNKNFIEKCRVKTTYDIRTPGDVSRACPQYNALNSELGRIPSYLSYRLVLTPPEVSHFWYLNFSDLKEGSQGFSGIFDRTEQSLANKIGVKYYFERFPDGYLKTVNAYASLDADSYSRFGFIGVILSGFIFMLLRFTVDYFKNNKSEFSAIYSSGLILLTFLPYQASIQSLLVPYGLVLFLPIMAYLKLIK